MHLRHGQHLSASRQQQQQQQQHRTLIILVVLRLQKVELLLDPLDGLHNVELEGWLSGSAGSSGSARSAGGLHKGRDKKGIIITNLWAVARCG